MTANFLDIDFEVGSFDAIIALYSIIHVPRHHYRGLLGLGASNWTNSFDVATTDQLLRDAGLIAASADIVEQEEPSGPERWLYVLAHPG